MDNDTVRIIIDLDCTLEQAAALGLRKGTALAVARLTSEAGIAALQPQPEPEPEPAPVKGGPLAKLAGMWCNDPQFQEWARKRFTTDPLNAESAARFVRDMCCIESRAELDSNPDAAAAFNDQFRMPYMIYQQGRTK